jgi:hypothetical protein
MAVVPQILSDPKWRNAAGEGIESPSHISALAPHLVTTDAMLLGKKCLAQPRITRLVEVLEEIEECRQIRQLAPLEAGTS